MSEQTSLRLTGNPAADHAGRTTRTHHVQLAQHANLEPLENVARLVRVADVLERLGGIAPGLLEEHLVAAGVLVSAGADGVKS